MPDDPIVEEVRRIRREIETECHGGSEEYFEHITQVQEKYRDRLVRRYPVRSGAATVVRESNAPPGVPDAKNESK